MKKGLLLAILFTFIVIALPVSASYTYNPVVEDTFVSETDGIISFDVSGNINFTASSNYGWYNETPVAVIKSGGTFLDLRSLWKFNNTAYQNKVIQGLKLAYSNAEFDCGAGKAFSAYYISDNSWDEYTVTYNTKPSFSASDRLTGVNDSAITNQLVMINGNLGSNNIATSSELFALSSLAQANANLMDSLYDSNQTSVMLFNTGGDCGALVGNKWSIFSKEKVGTSSINQSFRLDLVDSLTAYIAGTDTTNTYFDFETGFSSATSFAQADFVYNAVNNTLTPLVPATFVTSEDDNTNTLSKVTCSAYTPFTTNTLTSLDVPTGTYDIICFDLINAHNGNQFYGAIKIINNTNVRSGANPEFDFYYEIYSPSFVTLSTPSFTPDPAEAGNNVTFTWTTSQNATTGLRFRFLQNGVFSAWASVENSTLSTTHTATIPDNLMFQTFYQYQLYGTTQTGSTIASDIYNFTALDRFTTNQIAVISEAVYFDFETQRTSSTYFNGADFVLNQTTLGMLSYSPSSFITVEANAENTLQNFDCNLAPSYTTGTRTSIQNNSVFCFDLSTSHGGNTVFGAIKIIEFTTGSTNFYWAIYTQNFVTFFGVTKSPEPPESSRDLRISWQTSVPLTSVINYQFRKVNETSYSEFKTISDTTQTLTVHSATIPAGEMFLGDYRFYFTGNTQSNQTYTSGTFNFTVVNQTSGAFVSNPVASFLGIDIKSALLVISLLVSIIASVLVQLKTHDSKVATITFVTGLMIFTGMNWLPLIFGIVLGILAIFVALKFFADSIAGQQGS